MNPDLYLLNRRLAEAEADVAEGRVHVADEAFYEGPREHVRKVVAKRQVA